MSHAIDALLNGKVAGKLIVYDKGSSEPQAEAYLDRGDYHDVYEPTRREAAALIRVWRRMGLTLERSE